MDPDVNTSSLWQDLATNLTNVSQTVAVAHGVARDHNHCLAFNFGFNGVLIGFLCLMGLAGNTLSMIVLQKDYSNRVAAFLLQCLAIADSFVLLMSLLVLSVVVGWMPYASPGSRVYMSARPYLVAYVQPLGYIAQSLAIWSTVLLAVNRYIAVCCPFIAYRLCTMRKAIVQVVAVVFISVAFNFPRFFQFRVVTVTYPGSNATYQRPQQTAIGEKTPFGIVYTNAMYTILIVLLPLVVLLVFNTRIIQEMRNLRRQRHNSSLSGKGGPAGEDSRSEANITIVMVIIIIMFLVCHTPDRVLQILKIFRGEGSCPGLQFYVSCVCNFFIVFSSSTNFFIYYFFRTRFRRILAKQICAWTQRRGSGGGGSESGGGANGRFPSLMGRKSAVHSEQNCTLNTTV